MGGEQEVASGVVAHWGPRDSLGMDMGMCMDMDKDKALDTVTDHHPWGWPVCLLRVSSMLP